MSYFTPLQDQPHTVYRFDIEVAEELARMETMLPGVLAYGHQPFSRQWHRLTKMQEEHQDITVFGYYKAFVPLNCDWLFWHYLTELTGEKAPADTEHHVSASFPLSWPQAQNQLDLLEAHGRDCVKAMPEVRSFVPKMLASYQARGVWWSKTRPSAKLVYPCGAGKTLTAILSALTRPGPVVVIAPAKARRVWWDQVQEYTHIKPLRVIPKGQMRRGDQTLEEYLDECRKTQSRPFVIFGAQSLPDYLDEVRKVRPEVLIFDELHTFGQSKRWKPVFDSEGNIDFERRRTATDTRETRAVAAMDVSRLPSLSLRIGLTATPLDDGRPRRLWSQLDLLSPGTFGMGYRRFAYRYCAAHEGEYGGLLDTGSSNIEELKARASFLIQEVTHTESHGQLPATRVQVVWLDPSDQNRPAAMKRVIAAAEKQALKTHSEEDRMRALEANLMEASSRKRTYVIEEVLEALRGQGKVVLFTARRQDCEDWASRITKALQKEVKSGNLRNKMPDVWWGHGGTDDREREDMVVSFKNSDGPCILIGTGQAFGESVDGLQTADLAIFAMLPWRPGDFEQWKGRFDRLGGRPTLLKVVLAKRSYDEKVSGILAEKIGPIREFLAAEQYEGLDDKLMGIDDRDAMRASVLDTLFGGEG